MVHSYGCVRMGVVCVWVFVCTYMLGVSFNMVMLGGVCVYGCVVCRGFVSGLWCPSMRMGDVVGVPNGGGWVEGVSEKGGVRWSLVEVFLIGEREIDSCGFDIRVWVCCVGTGCVF